MLHRYVSQLSQLHNFSLSIEEIRRLSTEFLAQTFRRRAIHFGGRRGRCRRCSPGGKRRDFWDSCDARRVSGSNPTTTKHNHRCLVLLGWSGVTVFTKFFGLLKLYLHPSFQMCHFWGKPTKQRACDRTWRLRGKRCNRGGVIRASRFTSKKGCLLQLGESWYQGEPLWRYWYSIRYLGAL